MTDVEKCIKRIKCQHAWIKSCHSVSSAPNWRSYMDDCRSARTVDSAWDVYVFLTIEEKQKVQNAALGGCTFSENSLYNMNGIIITYPL